MGMIDSEQQSAHIQDTELQMLLERLTGQGLPLRDESGVLSQVAVSISAGQSLGYSQFNELLLNVGYDRVDRAFFLFLCDPEAVSVNGDGAKEISSPQDLRRGVNAFRELALLLYGNVKYGFKALSRDSARLRLFITKARSERSDRDFRSRHEPLVQLQKVEGKDAYLLGYISGAEIEAQLSAEPNNDHFLERQRYRNEIIERGRWNHSVYLTYDHLDVYVATSMRERHEYVFVNEFMTRIETNPHIKDLRLRFFDPTAAFCESRFDKGLAEALMLKRAACTVYLAQESDTLGKDSELASTLAQGKPVIAFVPEMSDKFWEYLCQTFKSMYDETQGQMLLRILRIYNPEAAWNDEKVRQHLSGKQLTPDDELESLAKAAVGAHYDKRAKVLKDVHPLGLQTNLSTGVANGVLVVRHVDTCAQLIKQIMLNKMEFDVEDEGRYVYLREKISRCIFRVMTGDRLLTNSFWNFYNAVAN